LEEKLAMPIKGADQEVQTRKSIGVRGVSIHRRRILKVTMLKAKVLRQRIPERRLSGSWDTGNKE
jgi:hypothetical protein